VVLQVEIVTDIVRIAGIALRNPSLESLLDALRGLVERVRNQPQQRVSRIQLQALSVPAESSGLALKEATSERPLLAAAIGWVHEVLRDAIERVPVDNGDMHGFSVTRATLLQSLEAPSERNADDVPASLAAAASLDRALEAADASAEPLKMAKRVFELSRLEFRLMVLALAPELDHRYQRCAGFLLDEMSRRVGTLGLYVALLGGSTQVRGEL